MEMIYKMMILVVLVIFLVSGGFAVSNTCIDIVSANNYLEEISRVILESNYNPEVIDACCDEALEKGYQLSVLVQGNNRPGVLNYAKITFVYKYEIKMFGVSIEKQKEKIL